jgi:hypothetical protein
VRGYERLRCADEAFMQAQQPSTCMAMSGDARLTFCLFFVQCSRLADDIVQIDPATGKVVAFYDLSTLYPPNTRSKVSEAKTRESRKIDVDTK